MNNTNNITYEDLLKKIKQNITDPDELKMIDDAYNLASNVHAGEKRLNGDDFITHPLLVTDIVMDLNVDATTITAALLHEVMNKGITKEYLEEHFSLSVATIVEALTKMNKLELNDNSESSAIYLRKVLVGLATDVRVLFIKLADRLHNMRTNYAIKEENQKQKAYETEAVLIPIAHRLGINSIKSELENLCLYYTKRDVYNDILAKLNETQKELNDSLITMKENIIDILSDAGLEFKIKGRVKSVYSIYKKLNNGKKWSDIYDILALRVIVPKVSDCYAALGLVHAKFKPIPKRFKDYIAMPKANMYQSLHTTVFGVDGHLFEIQFRTYEMDEFAEKGMASHWSYKEKGTKKVQNIMEQKLEMFRNMIEANEDVPDKDFAEDIKNDLLGEMIYVFTPKGDVVELPAGSTPVDFAYRIHSDVGDKIIGATVGGVMVPINYELKSNDIVSIKTSNNATPNKDWLNFVKTTQAKNKIKSYFSKQERSLMIERGKNILEREFRKRKLVFSEVLSDENVKKILNDLKMTELDDIYLAVGTLRYTSGYIISLTANDKDETPDVLIEKLSKSKKSNLKNDIIIAGMGDVLANLAKCCKPVKGDEIIGFITKGQGITIHKKDCNNIDINSERIIDAYWNMDNVGYYFTDLFIEVDNDKNYISDIIACFTKRNINVDSFKTKEYEASYLYEATIKVAEKRELDKIIRDLEILPFVIKVSRSK